MSNNIQSAQFGNPFTQIGGLLTSAGPGGWFRRRAELRHSFNMKLIDQHFSTQAAEHASDIRMREHAAGLPNPGGAATGQGPAAPSAPRPRMSAARPASPSRRARP